MKRILLVVAIAAMGIVGELVWTSTTRDSSFASSRDAVTTALPFPIQKALKVVARTRQGGPLTAIRNVGSDASGVWVATIENHSPGILQHWSLEATDRLGKIALSIIVSDDGTEAVSGWVPGQKKVSNWVFSASGGSSATTYHATEPASSGFITSTAWNPLSAPRRKHSK